MICISFINVSAKYLIESIVSRVHVKFSRNLILKNKNTLRIFHPYILPNHKNTSPSTKKHYSYNKKRVLGQCLGTPKFI